MTAGDSGCKPAQVGAGRCRRVQADAGGCKQVQAGANGAGRRSSGALSWPFSHVLFDEKADVSTSADAEVTEPPGPGDQHIQKLPPGPQGLSTTTPGPQNLTKPRFSASRSQKPHKNCDFSHGDRKNLRKNQVFASSFGITWHCGFCHVAGGWAWGRTSSKDLLKIDTTRH